MEKLPDPAWRIIGDFSDKEKVLLGLDLLEIAEKDKYRGDPFIGRPNGGNAPKCFYRFGS